MIPLRDALDRALRSVRLQSLSTLARISACWPAIVGDHLAGVCSPASIVKNTLVIHVHDRAFLAPLDYARLQVLEKIHNVTGETNKVQSVTVRFSERPEMPFRPAAEASAANGPLSPDDERAIDAAVAEAAAPELKGSLARLFRVGARRGKKFSAMLAALCAVPLLAACATGGKSARQPLSAVEVKAAGGESGAISPDEAERKTRAAAEGYSLYLSAQALISQNKIPEALEQLRKAAKADPAALQVYVDISRVALALGKYRESIDAAQSGLVINPDYIPLNALLGGIYHSSKDYQQAEKYFRKTLELDPARTDIRLNLGVSYLEMKRYEDAERELLLAYKDEAHSQIASFYLARTYVEMKLYVKAEELLTTLIRNHPTFTKAYETLGWVYSAQEKFDLAIDTYRKYLEGDPENEPVRQRLANAFLMKKDYGGALEIFKELEKGDPGTLDLALKMGMLYFQRAEWKEALEKFQLVRLKDPANESARYYIALIYEEMGMFKESLVMWEEMTRKAGGVEAAAVYVHMGAVYEKMGQLDDTRAMLAKALALKKDDPDLHYLMGAVLGKKEAYAEAVKSLNRAIELAPTRAEFIFFLGATYEKMKEYDKCVAAMRKTLEIEPNHSDALNYIAYLYAVQNRNMEEALQLVHRALGNDADNGYYLDTLSWIYHRQGKNGLALETIKKAIANMKVKDATLYEHLGDIHYALGNFDDAAAAFAISVEVKKDPAVMKKLDDARGKATGTK